MKRSVLICFLFWHFSDALAQLVLPGEFPDPSVTKIGDTYWATATTSNWGPVFPVLASKDLIHWQQKAVVFDQLPVWADYYFWAPEITYDNGKVFVYYSAHKKDSGLCLAVAVASKPQGPYKDLGPIVCEAYGSIDAFPIRDETGKLFLVWKEDGNSVGKPTPIWISELREDRTGLIGTKRELFHNDAPWEANLVEGVSMLRHGGYLYAFYSAAGCCGRGCTYATGIARAKSLQGPWEKYSGNPVLVSDDKWKCPGHGTPVEKDGRYYFLYHGYDKQSNVYSGRQGLLREFSFTSDGWITFKNSVEFPNAQADSKFHDDFKDKKPSASWQWSVLSRPEYRTDNGRLELHGYSEDTVAFLGQKTLDGDYQAHTTVLFNETNAEAGIALFGDEENFVALSVVPGVIRIWKKEAGKESILQEESVKDTNKACLRIAVNEGSKITFSYSADGNEWRQLNSVAVEGGFLPPWDRAVRVGLISKGGNDKKAVFENFILYH